MSSRGVNKVLLVGRVGQDPEIKYTASGTAIANFSIATSKSWKDKNTNQKQEKTEWHRICLFNQMAETAGKYLKKGSKVYIEGELQTRKWQDQNGADHYTTEILGREMQFLDPPPQQFNQQPAGMGAPQGQGMPQQGGMPGQQQQAPQQGFAPQPAPQAPPAPDMDSFGEDIPF